MALLLDAKLMIFGDEVTFPNAYYKITNVSGNKDSVMIDVSIYKKEQSELVLNMKQHVFVPSQEDLSPRWDKQGYEYLKTLPEFMGAVDI